MTVPAVHAADTATDVETITLSPVDRHYTLKAGEVLSDKLTVINNGAKEYQFTAYARPYSVKDENYTPDFRSEPKNADAYQWVQFDRPTYTLKAGESTKVNYTVRVPKDAAPGGHYGVLFVETQPAKVQDGTAIVRKKRLGAIMYTTVRGTFKTDGVADSISVPFFQSEPPLTASQRIQNTGNSDFTVKSTMKVYDAFGSKKYEVIKDYTILPGTTRKLVFEWPASSWFGLYKAEVTTSFIGKSSTSSGYILMVPIWMYIVLGIVIIARVVYAWSHRTSKN